MSKVIPVLVVGAGPAGLVTALTLVQSGISVRIVDKDDVFHTGSRGFGVQPRTYELFETLGILDDVKKHATIIPVFRAYKPGTMEVVKEWTLYPPRQPWPDRPNGNGQCLRQEKLEEILRDHLAKYGVNIEASKGLVDIEQKKDDVVIATLAVFKRNEPTDEREKVACEYLVGADGAKGVTRKLLRLTFAGETRDADGQVWGDVEIDGLGNDYWHVWGNPGKWSIITRPLTPGSGNSFGVGITCQDFDPADLATPEKAEEFIHREIQLPNLKFGRWEWISYFKPNMRMVSKFHSGRAWIIGDAAHVHSPTGGQGMNNSVQDACNLGWKLALVLKRLAQPSLLDTLDEERLPVITQMLGATSQLYTHMVSRLKPKDTPSAEKAHERLDEDKKSGWYRWRNDALELYGVNYRYSSIVVEERDTTPLDMEDALAHAYAGYEGTPKLRAGDRAPDAPNLRLREETTTLFKLLSPARHTLLVFNADSDAQKLVPFVDAVSSYPKDVVQTFFVARKGAVVPPLQGLQTLVDYSGYAHQDYMVRTDAADTVIIRPDGFIGAILKDSDGIHKYFGKILGAM